MVIFLGEYILQRNLERWFLQYWFFNPKKNIFLGLWSIGLRLRGNKICKSPKSWKNFLTIITFIAWTEKLNNKKNTVEKMGSNSAQVFFSYWFYYYIILYYCYNIPNAIMRNKKYILLWLKHRYKQYSWYLKTLLLWVEHFWDQLNSVND